MQYKEFMGELQHRLELAELGDAVRATRVTLTTLGERIQAGEADDLASPLPGEVGWYLRNADSGQRFDFDEFLDRVAERANAERQDALYHAQVVVGFVAEQVPAGELAQVRGQLPEGFDPLFEFAEQDE